MFWECILSPQKIFCFQTVFLFTLEDDCNTNWIFFFPSQFWPLKIKISQIFFIILHRIVRSLSFKKLFGPKCWYLPLKIAPKAVDDKNQTKFFKANFNPLKLTILWVVLDHHGQIKCSLCLKKNTGQKVDFYP